MIDELKQLVDVVALADRSRVDGDSARRIDNTRNVFSGLAQLSSLASFVQETVEAVSLSPEEAAELLFQSQNPLVVFRNKFSNDINIVYTDYNGVAHLVSYK